MPGIMLGLSQTCSPRRAGFLGLLPKCGAGFLGITTASDKKYSNLILDNPACVPHWTGGWRIAKLTVKYAPVRAPDGAPRLRKIPSHLISSHHLSSRSNMPPRGRPMASRGSGSGEFYLVSSRCKNTLSEERPSAVDPRSELPHWHE